MGDGSPGAGVSQYAWAAPAPPLRSLVAWWLAEEFRTSKPAPGPAAEGS